MPALFHKKADLYIDGTVNESVLRNLGEFIQIWSNWGGRTCFRWSAYGRKTLLRIRRTGKKPAVIAFSGGVDASFSLAAHQSKLLGATSREIGLGVLIAGFDLRLNLPQQIEQAYEHTGRRWAPSA